MNEKFKMRKKLKILQDTPLDVRIKSIHLGVDTGDGLDLDRGYFSNSVSPFFFFAHEARLQSSGEMQPSLISKLITAPLYHRLWHPL